MILPTCTLPPPLLKRRTKEGEEGKEGKGREWGSPLRVLIEVYSVSKHTPGTCRRGGGGREIIAKRGGKKEREKKGREGLRKGFMMPKTK